MVRFWFIGVITTATLCAPAHAHSTPAAQPAAAPAHDHAVPRCVGPHYNTALSAIDANLIAYHVQNPARAQQSVAAGIKAAAQLDQFASTLAAQGCKTQALQTWRQVIRYFDGPAFTTFQHRALAGMRALRARR